MRGPTNHPEPVEFLSSILAAVPWIVLHVDLDLTVQYANRVVRPLRVDEFVSRCILDFLEPADRVIAEACYQKVLETGAPGFFEVRSIGPDGERATYANYVTLVLEDGVATGYCVVSVDVSEERERERELAKNQRELQLAVAATQMGLWSWNAVTDQVLWNGRMKEICGRKEPLALEAFVETLVHPDDRDQIQETFAAMRRDETVSQSTMRIIVDGAIRWIISTGQSSFDDGSLTGITGGVIDITEQRRTEEQLFHAQKMEAIGQLTTGVAHNFNNLLMVLLPTLEMLGEEVEESSKELVGDALAVSNRAADIVRKLMDLAGKKSSPRHVLLDLDELAEDGLRLCERTLERRLKLSLECTAENTRIFGDPGELTQVLVNVLINSRDALLGANTASPVISIAVENAGDDLVLPENVTPAEGWVVLRVRDNGPGIPNAIKEHLFEPFFTTKGAVGTGMGLATSAAILERHNGWLACETVVGEGAVFSAYLPLAREPGPDRFESPDLED